jgi:hypothetical protein
LRSEESIREIAIESEDSKKKSNKLTYSGLEVVCDLIRRNGIVTSTAVERKMKVKR